MAEYHPFLTHFPIALYVIAAVFGILRARRKTIPIEAVLYMVIFGAVISIFTAISGNAAGIVAQSIPNITAELEQHEQWGNYLAWGGIITAILLLIFYLKNKINRAYLIPLLILLALTALYTGKTGHKLVFKYGAGTEIVKSK